MNTSVSILMVPGEPCAGPEGWCRAGRLRCSQQGWLAWKSLYLSAMQQCTSTFPSPVLGSSSLSIHPPIVSANNRAPHICSIFHLGISERATEHQ